MEKEYKKVMKIYYRVYDCFEHEVFASKKLKHCFEYVDNYQFHKLFPLSIRKVIYWITDNGGAYVVSNQKID